LDHSLIAAHYVLFGLRRPQAAFFRPKVSGQANYAPGVLDDTTTSDFAGQMPYTQIDIPPHIAETIQSIALLHAEHQRQSTLAARIVDRLTLFVGRPISLLALLAAASLWIMVNTIILLSGGAPFDPPPFGWMELSLTLIALMIAVMILTSQSRADRFADLREQMTLEATLLTEQKTRKIIELLEELRRDSPGVLDRRDIEAEQMAAKKGPHES
jgi:uncharacterized membrane protein